MTVAIAVDRSTSLLLNKSQDHLNQLLTADIPAIREDSIERIDQLVSALTKVQAIRYQEALGQL